VMIFPVAAVALSVMLVRLPDRERVVNRLVVTVVILSVAASLSSPINQEWFVAGRDRIWWPVKTETSLGRLRRAAGLVRGMAGEDRLLLTQDAYLAVESGLSLPAGLEMGPFSYFPDWSEARAAQLHVLNRAMMERLIGTTRARVAALSGWCFAIQSPQVIELPAGERGRLWAAVNRRYGPVTEIAGFGQAATTLKIMALHADAGSEGALNRTENQGERR